MASVKKRKLYTRQRSLLKTNLRSILDPQEDHSKRVGTHTSVILEMKKAKEQKFQKKYIWK